MTLGRVFRRMGLPLWTFLGVGIAAIWFNYFGVIVERGLRDLLGINEQTRGLITYAPPTAVFFLPFLAVMGTALWQKARYGIEKGRWTGSELPGPEGRKGIILLVSNPASAIFAIEYHFREKGKLETVWLIPSNDLEKEKFGGGTGPAAQAIKQRCEVLAKEANRPLEVIIHSAGVSPADSQDTFDYVNRVFRHRRYEPGELVADFTGGTKPMSVGMIMACLPTERELEYVSFNQETRQSYGPYLIDYQHSAFDLVG